MKDNTCKYLLLIQLNDDVALNIFCNKDNSVLTSIYNILDYALKGKGFSKIMKGVYECNSPVQCVTIVQELKSTYYWFESTVKTLKMLRVTDRDDLMQVLQ